MKKVILLCLSFLITSLSASAQTLQNQPSVKFVQASSGVSDQYLTNLLMRISKYWVTSRLTHQLNCELEFQVNSNGQIVRSQTTKSSGDSLFDKDALDSVRLAAPFPPPESEFLIMISMDNTNLNDSVLRQNQQRQMNKMRSATQSSSYSTHISTQVQPVQQKSTYLTASVEKNWTKPIRVEELRTLDEFGLAQYRTWLLSWIRLPLEVRYPDLAKDIARLPQ